MSIHILREANRAIEAGVEFTPCRQSIADMTLGGGGGVSISVYLKNKGIETLKDFCFILGMTEDAVRKEYRYKSKAEFDKLIAKYKSVSFDDWLRAHGAERSELELITDLNINNLWRDNRKSKLKKLIDEMKEITNSCVSSM